MTITGFTTRIYKVGRGVDLWRWLCRRCLEGLKGEGWEVRDQREPPRELPCDGEDCTAARNGAVTP